MGNFNLFLTEYLAKVVFVFQTIFESVVFKVKFNLRSLQSLSIDVNTVREHK